MTCISLFSGCGLMDLGLERAGFTIKAQVEIDDYCRRVLAKHWPDVPRYGDIREVTGEQLGYCDLLAGGPPCQPSSVAGRRAGRADGRWLWPEFARLVREIRPRFVLLENPTGLLTVDGGAGFGSILADLADLGFDAEWQSLPAIAFGAPHLRWRVFLVAHTDRHGRGNRADQPEREPRRDRPANACVGREDLSDADRQRQPQPQGGLGEVGRRTGNGGFALSLPTSGRERQLRRQQFQTFCESARDLYWPEAQPGVCGVVDGCPDRVERLTALGNSVLPQIAEYVGRRIMEAA